MPPISVDRQCIHASSPSLYRGAAANTDTACAARARDAAREKREGCSGGEREAERSWKETERTREGKGRSENEDGREQEGNDEGGGRRGEGSARLAHHGLFLYSIDFSKSSWWESGSL